MTHEIGPQTFEQFLQEPVDMVQELQQTAEQIGARDSAVQKTLRAMILGGAIKEYPEHGVDGLMMSRQSVRELLQAWEHEPLRRPRNIGEKSLLLLGVFCHDETALASLAATQLNESQAINAERLQTRRGYAFEPLRVGNKVIEVVRTSSLRSVMRNERPADQTLPFQGIFGAIAKHLHPKEPPLQRSAGSFVYPSGVVFTDTYASGARIVRSVGIIPKHFEVGYTGVIASGQDVPGFTPRVQEATEYYIESIRELLQQES
ncbi:MAG TPA: hypothetical protein VFI74_03275 [Candidatus Saccharimonadales bacterium]|nr:hypothetical protein [Candidatus Saccharimonadales bacterium]